MVIPHIIKLPKIEDSRGNLSFYESLNHVPFEIKRSYWIYDVPGGQTRGGHAFIDQHEFIIALSGSFDVKLNDGVSVKSYSLNRSYYGLYVPNMIWREMLNFSTNSLALIVSSTFYSESDYIRDYDLFLKIALNEMKYSRRL
jgi:hypothetical protein